MLAATDMNMPANRDLVNVELWKQLREFRADKHWHTEWIRENIRLSRIQALPEMLSQ